MGDNNRFRLFSDLISDLWPTKNTAIADVASGNRKLYSELYLRGYNNIESWDKRHRNAKVRRGLKYAYFDYKSAPKKYELIIGMHPDQASDHIVMYANKHTCPFIICPCCVLPSAIKFENIGYVEWIKHLYNLAGKNLKLYQIKLPMIGRNIVIYGTL